MSCLMIYILPMQVLLRADKSAANFSDKSLLKNLGHWLGMLTLAKNKPILHTDIDMKSLLIESYNKGLQVRLLPNFELHIICLSNIFILALSSDKSPL